MLDQANEDDVAELTAVFRDAVDPEHPSVAPDTVEVRVKHGSDPVVTYTYGVDMQVTKTTVDGVITYALSETLSRPASYTSGATWPFVWRWVATGSGGSSRWGSAVVSAAPI